MRVSAFAAMALGLLSSLAPPAAAQLTGPDGLELPQAVSARELEDVTNTNGFPGEAVTLPALFAYRGEAIDFELDARTEPSVFSPLCSFSGTLVLRGGGCQLTFGWYNAVESGGAPPAADQIFPLIPRTDTEVYGFGAFSPLAMDGPWTYKTFTADGIRSDVRYAGGMIGFALVGDGPPDCTQTKYSQRELNTVCTNCTPPNQPWITTVVYQSTAVPDAFYMAFEDLPMSPTDFTGFPDQGFRNDGDFNDFVFFITGLVCAGGGEPCDTGLSGACAVGRTDCSTDASEGQCRQVVQPTDEACDNVDNDCNGQVDDGDLCEAGMVCDRGSCVAACTTGEFPCRVGTVCENGFCIDELCAGVDCDDGYACRAGDCVSLCEAIVCPLGQECQLGRCVNLCGNVMCGEGQVCEQGLCLATCGCRDCGPGRVCAESGQCLDVGCETLTCPAGEVCVAGACVDACAGAACPGGVACALGSCGEPPQGGGSGGAGGGVGIDGGGGLVIDIPGTGGSGAEAGGAEETANDAARRARLAAKQPGCACRTTATQGSGSLGLVSLLALAVALLRRRKSAYGI